MPRSFLPQDIFTPKYMTQSNNIVIKDTGKTINKYKLSGIEFITAIIRKQNLYLLKSIAKKKKFKF